MLFVSMPFKGRTKSMINFILSDLEIRLKEKCICNYDYEAPETGNIKMHQLGHAISIMAECDGFVMLTNSKGQIMAKGCLFEEQIWKEYGKSDIMYIVDDYAKFNIE